MTQKEYENWVLDKIMTPMRENEIKDLFSFLGTVERISRGKSSSSDFQIKNKDMKDMKIEVTSVNLVSPYGVDFLTIDKIEDKIRHIIGKSDMTNATKKIGVIYFDIKIRVFKDFSLVDYSKICTENNLDCLVLMTDRASINGESSREVYPNIVFFSEQSLFTDAEQKNIIHKISNNF